MEVKTGYHSNYRCGIRAENIIKRMYVKNGWEVEQSVGSRGVADLICEKGNTSHYVQCKSSIVNNNPKISTEELGRLKSTATRNNATAIVAKIGVSGDKVIKYAKTNLDVVL